MAIGVAISDNVSVSWDVLHGKSQSGISVGGDGNHLLVIKLLLLIKIVCERKLSADNMPFFITFRVAGI